MSVKWDVAKPIFAKPGNYTISGTVEGLAQKAIANIEVKNKMNLGGIKSEKFFLLKSYKNIKKCKLKN